MRQAIVLAVAVFVGSGCVPAGERQGYDWHPSRSGKWPQTASACRVLYAGDVEALRGEERIALLGHVSSEKALAAAAGCAERGGTHMQDLGRIELGDECETTTRKGRKVFGSWHTPDKHETTCKKRYSRNKMFEVYVVKPRS
jgi:hypothetical protein